MKQVFLTVNKNKFMKNDIKNVITSSSRLEVAQFLKYQMQIFKSSCFFCSTVA